MTPAFSIGPDGQPLAASDQRDDPHGRIAAFLMGEIYLSLETADEMLHALADPACRKNGWQWHGNSHSLLLEQNHCVPSFAERG